MLTLFPTSIIYALLTITWLRLTPFSHTFVNRFWRGFWQVPLASPKNHETDVHLPQSLHSTDVGHLTQTRVWRMGGFGWGVWQLRQCPLCAVHTGVRSNWQWACMHTLSRLKELIIDTESSVPQTQVRRTYVRVDLNFNVVNKDKKNTFTSDGSLPNTLGWVTLEWGSPPGPGFESLPSHSLS